jgi:hypothetical protein
MSLRDRLSGGEPMQLKYKLVLLELIGGLFGWVWILVSLAALYFLVMALFAGGSWWRFIIALGIGAVGKWLAVGFEDNKRRVAFEAALVAGGLTPTEAGKVWFDAYMGRKRPPDVKVPQDRKE